MRAAVAIVLAVVAASSVAGGLKNEWTPSWQDPSNGVQVLKSPLGSGEQTDGGGVDVAAPVSGQYYHVPGFLPGHPTAATIYPQVKTVDCSQVGEKVVCDGYTVDRSTGRGEYIYIAPRVKYDSPEASYTPSPSVEEPPHPPVKAKPKKARRKRVPSPITDKLLHKERECK